jgi:hypothetical protein
MADARAFPGIRILALIALVLLKSKCLQLDTDTTTRKIV